MEYRSPISMLFYWEQEAPNKVYLRQPVDGVWYSWSWHQVAREVKELAAALQALDLPKKSHIALLSKNCAHWFICDLAIMLAGHVSIPLYANLQQENIKEILERSESVVLFAGKLDNWADVKEGVPRHIKCISFPFTNHDDCESWASFIDQPSAFQGNGNPELSELCSIVYTSGTSGTPKGAMFSFAAMAFVAQNAIAHVGFNSSDRFFSYLPLSHVAERMLVEMCSLYAGAQVSFTESLQSFTSNIVETKPTVFLGVHRIWSKFHQGIVSKLSQKKLDTLLRIPVISHFIKKKLRKSLGLNEAVNVFTGASPTPPDLIRWFARLGIRIQEAYAMTENCCYSHVTIKERIKIGFVGQPLPLCEVRLGDDNEIQTRHIGMMQGYYKDLEKTAEAFTDDGFLKTGDEGFIDEEGFLKITGRIKDIFKTAKGKYVVPSPIEMKLAANPFIEQVCVVGSALPQPMALMVLSEVGNKKKPEEIITALTDLLRKLNDSLDAHEKLHKIVILKDQWLVENNLLTPSLKIKRNEIEKRYASFYPDWYAIKSPVIIIKPTFSSA